MKQVRLHNQFWLTLLLSCCTGFVSFAQSIAPTLIGTTGNSGTVTPTLHISYSVGEPVIETFSTASGHLTQGFHQPTSVCPTVTSLSVTPVSPVCAGTSVSILPVMTGASGSEDYFWSSGETTSSIVVAPTVTTAYTFSVTGCSATVQSVTVTVSAGPVLTASAIDPTCFGLCNATATVSPTGGTAPYTFAWNDPSSQTAQVATQLCSGNYTVTVTDMAGCSSIATVTVNPGPVLNASVTASPASVCTGGVTTLTATGGTSYQWLVIGSTGSVVVSPPVTAATTFSVAVTSGTCTDTVAVPVNITNFSALISITNNDSTLCEGETSQLTATSGTAYAWTPGGGSTQNIAITPTTSTMYYVSVTGSGGCVATDSIFVTVVGSPTATITSSADTACLMQTVTLTASGGGTYQWTGTGAPATAVFSPVLTSVGDNTYSVTVSNGSCSSVAVYTVYANPLPSVSANASPPSICPGDTSFLTAAGANSYVWSTGAPTASTFVTPNSTTTYTVLGTGAGNCSNFATVTVTLNTISVNAGPDITICPGFTAQLDAIVTGSTSGVSYQWSPDSLLNDPFVQNPSASPDTTTLFIVNVSNGSCTASDSVLVHTVRDPSCVIHVYNGITPNGDNDNNTWHIDGIEGYPENKVLIFNRWGSQVWKGENYDNKKVVWKGTDQQGNLLTDATYYYVIELYDGNGGILYSESSWVEVTH